MILNNHELNPEAYYSAHMIIKNGWFPWFKSLSTFLKVLKKPQSNAIYRPVISVSGQQVIRRIKGETILRIVEQAQLGKLKHE